MHAIDEALRDKILNLLAAFCFELKLSRTNDEGFCVLYFIQRDLGGYPLSSRTLCSFEFVFFSCGPFASSVGLRRRGLRSASVRNFTHGYRQSTVKFAGNA